MQNGLFATEPSALTSAELTSWWEEAEAALGRASVVVVRGDTADGHMVQVNSPVVKPADLPALVEALEAKIVVVGGDVATQEQVDAELARLRTDTASKDAAIIAELQAMTTPALVALDILIVGTSNVMLSMRTRVADCLDQPSVRGGEEDEDDDSDWAGASSKRMDDAGVTALVERYWDQVVAEDSFCRAQSFEVVTVLRRLIPELQDQTVYLPPALYHRIQQAVVYRHHDELQSRLGDLISEVMASVPAALSPAAATLEELMPYAKQVQQGRHQCATNHTARSLARAVKQAAKQRPEPLFA